MGLEWQWRYMVGGRVRGKEVISEGGKVLVKAVAYKGKAGEVVYPGHRQLGTIMPADTLNINKAD